VERGVIARKKPAPGCSGGGLGGFGVCLVCCVLLCVCCWLAFDVTCSLFR